MPCSCPKNVSSGSQCQFTDGPQIAGSVVGHGVMQSEQTLVSWQWLGEGLCHLGVPGLIHSGSCQEDSSFFVFSPRRSVLHTQHTVNTPGSCREGASLLPDRCELMQASPAPPPAGFHGGLCWLGQLTVPVLTSGSPLPSRLTPGAGLIERIQAIAQNVSDIAVKVDQILRHSLILHSKGALWPGHRPASPEAKALLGRAEPPGGPIPLVMLAWFLRLSAGAPGHPTLACLRVWRTDCVTAVLRVRPPFLLDGKTICSTAILRKSNGIFVGSLGWVHPESCSVAIDKSLLL